PQPHERAEERPWPLPRASIDEIRDRRAQLLLRDLGVVGLENPRLRLDYLRERPKGDPLAVRQRSSLAPKSQDAPTLDELEKLTDEPRLPDARHADDRDELRRRLLTHTHQRLTQKGNLPISPDDRRRSRKWLRAHTRARLYRLPDGNRFGLPF